LKVVFVDHCAVLSGAELSLARLVQALDVEAHVVLGQDGPLGERLEKAGATVHILPLPGPVRDLRRHRVGIPATKQAMATLPYIVRLRRLLRRLSPDLVHTNTLKSALYAGVAGRLGGIPVIWHLHDRIAKDYLPGPAVHLVKFAARLLPSGIIANSEATRLALGATGCRVAVIPSPVDIQASGTSPHRDHLRVGMLGRIAPWKGQDLFLRAFAKAFPNNGAEAVIVGAAMFGEVDFEEELMQLVHSLGLADRVEFRGFRDDIAAELAGIDMAVNASRIPEPFGQVVVEAMAAGVAVVAADQGGPAEIVEDGVSGLLYRMGDECALADALNKLANDPPLRSRLIDAGRRAAERYVPSAIASDVRSFYESVIGK